MSDLYLVRDIFTTKMTLGTLYYKGIPLVLNGHNIYIGEDVARPNGVKIPKETAVTAANCWIDITYSERFKKKMPIVFTQDDYTYYISGKTWTGIRVHPGNTEADTEGCQLVGLGRNSAGVWDSNKAFDLYFPFLEKLIATNKGRIPYTIINNQPQI